MKALIWACGVASIVCTVPVAADAATTRSAASDAQLKSRIEHRLHADHALSREHISVNVDRRVATLSGHVDSRTERLRADRLAHLNGIVRVNDRLAVDARGTTGYHTSDRVAGTTGTVASRTKEGLNKTGEEITDGWITGHVKTRFIGEDSLKGSRINVDTNDHVVTLKGSVPSRAGRARAVELARTTDGVHRVVDELSIAHDAR